MVKAIYHPGAWSLTISGHAGYAEPGRDIVCAGVSVLAAAVCRSLEGIGSFMTYDDGDVLRIACIPPHGEEIRVSSIFSVAVNGLALLEREYPGYVKLSVIHETRLSQ